MKDNYFSTQLPKLFDKYLQLKDNVINLKL